MPPATATTRLCRRSRRANFWMMVVNISDPFPVAVSALLRDSRENGLAYATPRFRREAIELRSQYKADRYAARVAYEGVGRYAASLAIARPLFGAISGRRQGIMMRRGLRDAPCFPRRAKPAVSLTSGNRRAHTYMPA